LGTKITLNSELQTLKGQPPHEAPLSNMVPHSEFRLKFYSKDFEMLFQTRLSDDVPQMDLCRRTLAKPPAQWFYDTPLFSPTHPDTIMNQHNFLKK